MIRRRIILSAEQPVYIKTRDSVKNLLEHALHCHGYQRLVRDPVRWGFGVHARRVANQRFYRVHEIIVGSSEPSISSVIERITVADLVEPNAVPGAGISLQHAEIFTETPWVPTPVAQFIAVSPLRVLAGHHQTILELGQDFERALNRTMQTRFSRRFHLEFRPDSWYVRRRNGNIVARMAIKQGPNGRITVYPGLVLPFVLMGPPEDIAVAWYSGLGGSTGMGFGCIAVANV